MASIADIIPEDYLQYNEVERRYMINKIILYMIDEIQEEIPECELVDTLREIFTNSLIINVRMEAYELAAVCRDVLRTINEHTNEEED